MDRRYVQRIERGTANPGVEVLARLRKSFRFTREEFWAAAVAGRAHRV